ncbi:hypothetical protein [Fluviicola taffensis]|uniref:hypothetical protein n=1 Tax=Fluviicola taffensis TaxID=191579 RepID=UPI003137F6C0
MNKELLEVLYKIRNEETLSNENNEALSNIINVLETENDHNKIKQALTVFMRIFLDYFNPEDWDIF